MGTLYIVATPIGNLKDITLRALQTFREVDYVLCEDTRITGKLLKHYGIVKKMVIFGDFNEKVKTPSVIEDLIAGRRVALVSDAGTPLISDPGFNLVREAINKNIRVEPIPGPSAVIAALAAGGLPTDKFIYLGYLPKKEVKQKKVLAEVKLASKSVKATVVIFESPYRVLKTLENIKSVFGKINIVVSRELTKIHQEILRKDIAVLVEHFKKITPKGEFVILFVP